MAQAVLDTSRLSLQPAAGDEYRADCPFCSDRRRRLYVNFEKRCYFCFNCGTSGAIESPLQYSTLPKKRSPEPPYPSPERLHQAYSTLLNLLMLSREHTAHLMSPTRGLSLLQIRARRYRTFPLYGRSSIAAQVSRHANIEGIPGFYINKKGHWTLAGAPGLLLPVQDFDGHIRGLQIRPDDRPDGMPKYIWLSSTGRFKGRSAKTAFHVSRPPHAGLKCVWITEGPLKADIAAFRLGETFVAVPGVNTVNSTGLVPALVAKGVKQAIIAYDADALVNEQVADAALRLALALSNSDIEPYFAHWEYTPETKGIDDLLLKGGTPRILTPQELPSDIRSRSVYFHTLPQTKVEPINKVEVSGIISCISGITPLKIADGGTIPYCQLSLKADVATAGTEDLVVGAWGNMAEQIHSDPNLVPGVRVVIGGVVYMTDGHVAISVNKVMLK